MAVVKTYPIPSADDDVHNRVPLCFCAARRARRTARSTATGAWWRTGGCAGGRVVQRHVLYLGEINDSQQEAWRKTIEIFEDGQSPPAHGGACFRRGARSGRWPTRHIVRIRLSATVAASAAAMGRLLAGAASLWEQLGLDQFWAERLPPSRKGTRWDLVLQILGDLPADRSGQRVAACIGSGSSTARWPICWARTSELAEIHKLYECLDRLLAHKRRCSLI